MNMTQQFEQIPEPLRAAVEQQWQTFEHHFEQEVILPGDIALSLPRVWACSEFVMHTCVRYPEFFLELANSDDLMRSLDWEGYRDSIQVELNPNDEAAWVSWGHGS